MLFRSENLHLCISSKFYNKFLIAIEEIEQLLKGVYKEYKNYCENYNVDFCMLTKEQLEIENLVKIMKSNIFFFSDIYRDGNVYETPAIGMIHGLNWKGKADIITDDFIIDLKTTSDINKFKYSSKNYNYDSQCYIYQQLFQKPLVFYVIDKESGQLGIFRPSESFIRGGEEKGIRAISIYQTYFGDNQIGRAHV